MKASVKQRVIAYLLDLILIGLVFGLIGMIKGEDKKVLKLREELQIVEELYVDKQIEFDDYFERFSLINQQLEQESALYSIVNLIFIIGYLCILPYFWNGQTLGKRFMKIQIIPFKEEKVTLVSYLIRNIILNGLGYMVLYLAFLYVLPSQMYFIFQSILSFVQILLVIFSVSMVLYRRDKRGLHDIFSGTKVVVKS